MRLPGILAMGLVFRLGLVHSRFVRRSGIHRFLISEESDDFVRIPFTGQNYFVWPSLRTRAAARLNVDDSIRGCMAGALALFGSVTSPLLLNHNLSKSDNAETAEVGTGAGGLYRFRTYQAS